MAPKTPSANSNDHRFWWNAGWLVSLVFAAAWWFPRYTNIGSDSAPLVFGVAALAAGTFGSVWAWIGEDRQARLRAPVRRWLLESGGASRLYPLLFLVLSFTSFQCGAIEVAPSAGNLTVQLGRSERVKTLSVSSGESVREPFHCFFWDPAVVEVRAEGLPSRRVELSPFGKISIDHDWFRLKPCLLLTPSSALIDQLQNNPKFLVITVAGDESPPMEYRGEAVWIGARDRLPVPLDVLEKWKFLPGMTDSILSECRNPVSVPGVPTHIPEDAVVRVELLREAPSEGEDRKPYLRSFEFHLRKATHPDQFPRTRQLMTAAEQDDLENP